MNTAGLDFFDQDFFQNQVVASCNYPISKMKWYSSINDTIINEWKVNNKITDMEEKIARLMLDNFSADALTLPLSGENKIKHYFEKVLWLIQEYCINGWKNPLKGINHLDNGIVVIHPGTNRCVAAKFLNCKLLPILININKEQNLLNTIENAQLITDELSLRNTLSSNGKILWRTESQEELWINGIKQPGKFYKDFTYEFLDADAWPDSNNLIRWNNTILDMLPLKIYIEPNVNTDEIDKLSNSLKNLTFKSIIDSRKEVNLTYRFITVSSFNDIKDNDNFIFMSNESKFKKNIFELLYFISPKYGISKTADSSIIIKNSFASNNNTLIIPEHYVDN
jgi:hypothetical protein